MTADLDTLLTALYVKIDDSLDGSRPGRPPKLSDAELLCLLSPDGAWAEVDTDIRGGKYAVVQGGPRRLWDEAERAGRWWEQHGRPTRDRFGLTAHADGTGHYWLDAPGQPWITFDSAGRRDPH